MCQGTTVVGSVAIGISASGLLQALQALAGLPAGLAGPIASAVQRTAELIDSFFAGRADAAAHLPVRV
jgi:hypothetical protein